MRREEPQYFSFPAREKYNKLEAVSEYISGELLSNTDRRALRRLAENGGPLALIQEGMLAYVQELRYAIPSLDLRIPEELEKALKLQEEIRAVQWQIDFWERMLTLLPEEPETASQQERL